MRKMHFIISLTDRIGEASTDGFIDVSSDMNRQDVYRYARNYLIQNSAVSPEAITIFWALEPAEL